MCTTLIHHGEYAHFIVHIKCLEIPHAPSRKPDLTETDQAGLTSIHTWLQQHRRADELIINRTPRRSCIYVATPPTLAVQRVPALCVEHPQVDALVRADKQPEWQWVQKRF